MADIPVAAFALLSLYPLLIREFDARPWDDAPRLLAASLLAVGCALTKQAGLYAARIGSSTAT